MKSESTLTPIFLNLFYLELHCVVDQQDGCKLVSPLCGRVFVNDAGELVWVILVGSCHRFNLAILVLLWLSSNIFIVRHGAHCCSGHGRLKRKISGKVNNISALSARAREPEYEPLRASRFWLLRAGAGAG